MRYRPGIRPVLLLNPRFRFALIRLELWWECKRVEVRILWLQFRLWLRRREG